MNMSQIWQLSQIYACQICETPIFDWAFKHKVSKIGYIGISDR